MFIIQLCRNRPVRFCVWLGHGYIEMLLVLVLVCGMRWFLHARFRTEYAVVRPKTVCYSSPTVRKGEASVMAQLHD